VGWGCGGVGGGVRAPPPHPQTPNPQSPIPNPQYIFTFLRLFLDIFNKFLN